MDNRVIRRYWLLSAIILLIHAIYGCGTKQQNKISGTEVFNKLTEVEKSEGWILLFDGETLKGWRGVGKDVVPEHLWKVENGTIRNVGSGEVASIADGQPADGGDLMTTGTFDNFELYFEWKIDKAGNTGLKYNVSEEMSLQVEPKYSALGFEYQLLDDADPEYKEEGPTHLSGALYDLIPAENKLLKPVGEYNSSRILVCGNHVEHWLNEIKVLEFEFGSERLDSLCKKSKYRDYTGFTEKRKGHIVLQNHKDDAWFRNIKIRVF